MVVVVVGGGGGGGGGGGAVRRRSSKQQHLNNTWNQRHRQHRCFQFLRKAAPGSRKRHLAGETADASPRRHVEISPVKVKDTHLTKNSKLPPAEILCGECTVENANTTRVTLHPKGLNGNSSSAVLFDGNFVFLWSTFYQNNLYKMLHMARQLCFRGMCKIWSELGTSSRITEMRFFYRIWITIKKHSAVKLTWGTGIPLPGFRRVSARKT